MIKVSNKIFPTLSLIYIIALDLIGKISGHYNNYFIIIDFFIYLISIYILDKRFLLRFIYIIFYITTNVIGVFIIETNTFYLSELGCYSHSNNSLSLIVIAQIIFIETMRIINYKNSNQNLKEYINFNYKLKNIKINKIKLVEILMVIVFLLTLLLLIKVIDKPFFILKVDRFIYKQRYLSSIDDILTNIYIYLAPLMGVYFYKTKDKKIFILLGTISIYLFWIGHKFGYFLNITYMFMLPNIISIGVDKIKNIFGKLIIVATILIGIVLFQSFVIWERDVDESITYLNMRLSQQGQLWWATYGNEKAKKININEIEDETKTYFNGNIEEDELLNSGIYKIMKLTTRKDIFNNKVYIKNSRYAYSTQASVYYYFNSFGLILFSIISAIIYYIINNNLVKSIINVKIIKMIIWTRVLVVMNRVLTQSDFDKLFSYQMIFLLFILALLKVIEGVENRKIKR